MRHVFDYELEYFSYGGGAMMIEGKRWPIHRKAWIRMVG
jgi:hypothetical protein